MTILTPIEVYKDWTQGSNKKIKLQCDSGKNSKCLGIFERHYYIFLTQRARTIDKDYCKFCQKTEEFSGRNHPGCKYIFDDNLFEYIDTPIKAYILGWIASDGAIEKDKFTIKIKDCDVQVLKYIRDNICKDIPVRENKLNCVILSVCSTKMCRDILNHLGLQNPGKKDSIVQFPKLEKNLYQYFIRGFFEGDGCITNKIVPRVNITCNSINMLKSMQELLLQYNIVLSISTDRNTYRLQTTKGSESIKFLEYIYNDTINCGRLERKYIKYLDSCNWKPSLNGHYKAIDSVYGDIRFSKTHKDAVFPEIVDYEATGIDLTLIEKVKDWGTTQVFTTGLKVSPPTGYYFLLFPRSSISKTGYILANGVGVIDKNYSGDILVPLIKVDQDAPDLELPIRLVQLVAMPLLDFEIVRVDSFDEETTRGDNGFGSTGK